MDRYNVTTPLNIDPEQIRLAEPKAAKYSGIEAGKATKTLDSHGKLVSHWGRNIKHSFDKTQIYKEKYGTEGSIHTFQKYMTERRVEVLMQKVQEDQEGKNRSNHVDSILALPDEIQTECTFFKKEQYRRLVESDTEVYLSHEIKCCKSGASLVALKNEVNRLKEGNKVTAKVIDSLNKKIHHQLAVLVKAMPKHLKSIPYDGDPTKDFHMSIKKCEAIINLLNAANDIDEKSVNIHKQAFSNMMIDTFSRDIKEITKMCLARKNPIEKERLSKNIEWLSRKHIKPFLERISSLYGHYYRRVAINTARAVRKLDPERKIPHDPASESNNDGLEATTVKEKTPTLHFKTNAPSNQILPEKPAAPITFQGVPIDKKYNLPIIGEDDLVIKEKLGEGSFGTVNLVKYERANQLLALKMVRNDKERRQECAKMIRIQRAITSTGGDTENIIKIVAMSRGRSDEKYALMEYGGQDLPHYSKENGNFKDENLKNTIFQVVKGVSSLYKAGYQHHDIKPDNILITNEGVVKLCDFGLAEKMAGNEQKKNGTPLYMPLEKLYELKSYPNDKADSWSLGCTFAEMCLGCPVIDYISAGLLWYLLLNLEAAEERLDRLRESTHLQLLEKEGEQAADFFMALTELDPKKRLSPTEALEHPYLAS